MNGIGQDFSDFMKEQGLYEEAQEQKVVAAQFQAEMEKQNFSNSAVAARKHTT